MLVCLQGTSAPANLYQIEIVVDRSRHRRLGASSRASRIAPIIPSNPHTTNSEEFLDREVHASKGRGG